MQAVFSAIFYFAPIALYQGWLMVGYATVYTMAPVFSLVLDRDVNEDLALLYPELYKDLTKVRANAFSPFGCLDMHSKGRVLSYKTFFTWLEISLYQGSSVSARLSWVRLTTTFGVSFDIGSAIMIMSLVLFENEFLNIVSISFTALVLNELIMVALEITIWYDAPKVQIETVDLPV